MTNPDPLSRIQRLDSSRELLLKEQAELQAEQAALQARLLELTRELSHVEQERSALQAELDRAMAQIDQLPALNDAPANAAWLQEMRERHRDSLAVHEWELLGATVKALVKPRSRGLNLVELHNQLHQMAIRANLAKLDVAEQTQLRNAARLLWGLAHGVSANKLADLAAKVAPHE